MAESPDPESEHRRSRAETSPNGTQARTIYDVARHAGVGIGTVSRVLNGHINVATATRERVQTAIRELNYAPNPIARSLNSGRTHTLGVIVPFFTRPFNSTVLEGAQAEADDRGYDLVLYNVVRREQRDTYFHKLPMRRRVDGLLVVSVTPDDSEALNLRQQRIPAILVDCYNPHLTSIIVDNVGGAQAAVRHLFAQGRRRVGFVNGIVEGALKFNQSADRLTGYEQAHHAAGLPIDPRLVVSSEWNRAAARAAVRPLLQPADPDFARPDAIFAASDMIAAGVLEEAQALGLRVPEDVALVGFDGIEIADVLNISTMAQPMADMGRTGVRLLLDGITADTPTLPQMITLATQLVVRRTSAL